MRQAVIFCNLLDVGCAIYLNSQEISYSELRAVNFDLVCKPLGLNCLVSLGFSKMYISVLITEHYSEINKVEFTIFFHRNVFYYKCKNTNYYIRLDRYYKRES